MVSASLRRQIGQLISQLELAERGGDAEAIQQAYEDLFALCRTHDLDLQDLLRQPRGDQAPVGVLGTLKALWRMS